VSGERWGVRSGACDDSTAAAHSKGIPPWQPVDRETGFSSRGRGLATCRIRTLDVVRRARVEAASRRCTALPHSVSSPASS
jgi:hypothetical protein